MLKTRNIFVLFLLLIFLGCSSVQVQDYIKSDRSCIRKISANFDDIVITIKDVLYKEGWLIQGELKPSIYERRLEGNEQDKDILLFSEIKEHWGIFGKNYTHLNIYVRANADGAEVEIRYESFTPGFIKRTKTRNDQLVNGLLDKIEQGIESN